MAEYADLEIRLRRQSPETPGTYEVALRFTIPGSRIDYRLLEGTPLVALDVKRMLRQHAKAETYGRGLSEAFFADAGLVDAFTRARDLARHDGLPLRLRVFVDHRAQELHRVRWETLAHPKSATNRRWSCGD